MLRVHLADPAHLAEMNEAYAAVVAEPFPAHTTVYMQLPLDCSWRSTPWQYWTTGTPQPTAGSTRLGPRDRRTDRSQYWPSLSIRRLSRRSTGSLKPSQEAGLVEATHTRAADVRCRPGQLCRGRLAARPACSWRPADSQPIRYTAYENSSAR